MGLHASSRPRPCHARAGPPRGPLTREGEQPGGARREGMDLWGVGLAWGSSGDLRPSETAGVLWCLGRHLGSRC